MSKENEPRVVKDERKEPCCMGQVLVTARPYPHAQSHNRLEFGATQFGHSVENGDADPNFCLLVFEASRL